MLRGRQKKITLRPLAYKIVLGYSRVHKISFSKAVTEIVMFGGGRMDNRELQNYIEEGEK